MTRDVWMAWLGTGVAAALDWIAVARNNRTVEWFAKPAVMVGLLAVAWLAGAAGNFAGNWLLAALVLGMIGDVFLLGGSMKRFQWGLGSFLVGHLYYLLCFVAIGVAPTGPELMLGLGVVLACLIAARRMLPNVHAASSWALSVPVAQYMVIIAAMVIAAWGTGSWLIGFGATVFMISDTVLSLDRFVAPVANGRLIVMITYHLGQALIVAGVLERMLG